MTNFIKKKQTYFKKKPLLPQHTIDYINNPNSLYIRQTFIYTVREFTIPEDLILKYPMYQIWGYLIKTQLLSEKVIDIILADPIIYDDNILLKILKYQRKLSKEFYLKHIDKWDWEEVLTYRSFKDEQRLIIELQLKGYL